MIHHDTFSAESTLLSTFFFWTLFNANLFGSKLFVEDPYAVCGRANRVNPFLEDFGTFVGEEKTFGGVCSCGWLESLKKLSFPNVLK